MRAWANSFGEMGSAAVSGAAMKIRNRRQRMARYMQDFLRSMAI
jgi:hypothetical protein